MKQYHDLCRHVLAEGVRKSDRTNTGTISTFGYQMRFDLQAEGFPLMTTKELNFDFIKSELLWFIKGLTNIRFLLERKNNIWNEWAFERYVKSPDYDGVDMTNFGIRSQTDEAFKQEYKKEMKRFKERILTDDAFAEKYGDLGAIYGKHWRSWQGADGRTYDQLKWVIDEIKRNPDSRRLIVSAWNPAHIIPDVEGQMPEDVGALPPCHTLFQFNVADGKLSCQLFQRSGDVLIGVPYNVASYSLLTHMVAQITGLEVGEFIHTIGDAHIYSNHEEQVKLQLSREPYPLPTLKLNPHITSIEDFDMDDIQIENYQAHPHIKGIIAV